MNEKEFNAQVKIQLKKLGRKELVRFAGNCALRALPFTGMNGNFHYWEDTDRQIHLYTLFQTIDMGQNFAAAGDLITASAKEYLLADIAHQTGWELKKAAVAARLYGAYLIDDDEYTSWPEAIVAEKLSAQSAALSAAFAMFAAISACRSPFFDSASRVNAAADAAMHAHSAASTALKGFCCTGAKDTSPTGQKAAAAAAIAIAVFENILMSDIESLCQSAPFCHTDRRIYGPLWQNFRRALRNEGCDYWGRLYERMFDDAFVAYPDLWRMNVPAEISDRGAAAVSEWLESKEKRHPPLPTEPVK
ncbi:MAG: hypothetical protein LBS05_00940 [Tannerellaceae bacterium]|jgi:hypothetical protein|nr:hypothetical protein [Tannerellaceae bacterium]